VVELILKLRDLRSQADVFGDYFAVGLLMFSHEKKTRSVGREDEFVNQQAGSAARPPL
jgi:hypothetical protein